jgi:hypothetical protein
MMLGPDCILACPICHAAARVSTLLSGNTFGAILFTDGKMIAPMLPEMPALARCKGCGVFYWLSRWRMCSPRGPSSRTVRRRAGSA